MKNRLDPLRKRVVYKLQFIDHDIEGEHDWEWLETSDDKGSLIELMQTAERIKRDNIHFRIIEETTITKIVE